MNNKFIVSLLLISSVLFSYCDKTSENTSIVSKNFVSSYVDVHSLHITEKTSGQGYYNVKCSGNYYTKGDKEYNTYSEKYGDTDYNSIEYLMPVVSVVNDFQKINIYSDVDFPNIKAGNPLINIVEVSFFSPYKYIKTHYSSNPKLARINKMASEMTSDDYLMMYGEFVLHFTQAPTKEERFTIYIEMEASDGSIIKGKGNVRW